MINNSNLIVTAWDAERLVGLARGLTDFVYVTYLADLVVDEDYQCQGIGKQLIEEVQQCAEPNCMMILLAAPQANDYYPKLGFTHNPRAWMLKSNY
jgi:GNAT superfamily N-acetyltransferase